MDHVAVAKMPASAAGDPGSTRATSTPVIMEHLEGETLAKVIRRGPMAPARVADIGRQIASVLAATHGAGITHRDLKPDNAFLVVDHELASRCRVKVLDFGIAKLTGTLANASPRTVGTMGTPAYMSRVAVGGVPGPVESCIRKAISTLVFAETQRGFDLTYPYRTD